MVLLQTTMTVPAERFHRPVGKMEIQTWHFKYNLMKALAFIKGIIRHLINVYPFIHFYIQQIVEQYYKPGTVLNTKTHVPPQHLHPTMGSIV